MALADDIFAKVSLDAGVSAVLGAGSTCRVYPTIAPPLSVAPYAVWKVISSDPQTTHDQEPAGLDDVLIQFSVIGRSALEARSIRKALRAAFDGATLASGQPTIIEAEHDQFDQAVELYHAILEVRTFADALAS